MINERVCEGCGDCGVKSNCLSVQPVDTDFGRKTAIDQSSCNKDYSCLAGDCPSFLSIAPDTEPGTPGRARVPGAWTPTTFPTPPEHQPGRRDAHHEDHRHRRHRRRHASPRSSPRRRLLAGREVRALDQTGLAQKGGAVVSDIKISATADRRRNKAAARGVRPLPRLRPARRRRRQESRRDRPRTHRRRRVHGEGPDRARWSPTHVDPFPDADDLGARIRDATRAERSVFVDARGLSVSLLGSDQFANLFLAGAASRPARCRCRRLPIEQAIELNGVQVRQNLQAFRRGRQYVADPARSRPRSPRWHRPRPPREPTAAERAIIDAVGSAPGSELGAADPTRVPDLAAYQNVGYARDYAQFVARVRAAEQRIAAGTELSEAVARYLHKLMAYKDEYEVARLSLDPRAKAEVRAAFGPGAKEYYLLHPPLLRALGRKHKLRLGPWFRPAFVVLRMMKPLRGTAFDPFGYTRVRRTERELVGEYRAMIEGTLATLSEETYGRSVELAALPDMIRGYEEIKLASVEQYRARVQDLIQQPSDGRTRMAMEGEAR